MGAESRALTRVSLRYLRRVIVILLAVANLFVLGLAGYSLQESRDHYEQRAETQTRNTAEAVDYSLTRSIEKIDLVLQSIADELEHALAEGGITPEVGTRILARYQARLPEVEAIRGADAGGQVIFGQGLNPKEAASWADREYFIYLRDHPEAGLQVSRPRLGRVAKRTIVGFARRYNYPDGRFAGVVSAPIALEYFTDLLSRFNLGQQGSSVLRYEDLGLIARHPAAAGPAGEVGNATVSRELQEIFRSGVPAATYYTQSASDQRARVVSFRRVASAPFVVLIGVAQEDYLAEWYDEVWRTGLSVALFALVSLVSGWLLLFLLKRTMAESARNELFLRHASNGVHILDDRGNLIQASDRFCAMLGYQPHEMIGMNVSQWDARWSEDILLGEVLPRKLGQDMPSTFETRHRHKDGGLIDVEVNAASFSLEGKKCLFASSRDIGERKRQQQALEESEARLRQSEERYRLLLKNSPVGILHYNSELIVTFANDRLEDIMKVPRGHALGIDCRSLHDARVANTFSEALTGRTVRYEGAYLTSFNGLPLWLSIICSPLLDEAGNVLGGVAIIEDVTGRRRMEERERRQQEALVRLNEVATSFPMPLADGLLQALEIGARHLGLEAGIICRLEEGHCAVLARMSPLDTAAEGPRLEDLCPLVLERDGILSIPDREHSPFRDHPCCRESTLVAYVGAPLRIGGRVSGVVAFGSTSADRQPLDQGDEEFLNLLVRWVEVAIDGEESRNEVATSRARLQAIIENEPSAIQVLDQEGKFLQINQAGLDAFEADSLEQIGAMGLADFVVPEQRPGLVDLFHRAIGGEQGTMEIQVVGKKGAKRYIETQLIPLRNSQGMVDFVLGVGRDITASKEADSELRLAASVFSHAHEGIIICDADVNIVDVNPMFTTITGYERDDVLGRNPRLLASDRQDQGFYQHMWRVLVESGHWEGELWNRRRDGSIYAQRLTISRVRDESDRVTHYIGTFSDISLAKKHQAELERMAHYDALTDLPNRALLSDRIELALAQSRRAGSLVAVCYLDLDGFKAINDRLGHDAGDALLVEVAQRLKDTLRAGDTVARLGGDEFVLLLVGIANTKECETAATRILRALSLPILLGGSECSVSGSLGITLFPADSSDPDTLLRHADQAMYAAKQAGKNRYQIFDVAPDPSGNRLEVLARLRQGLESGELCLYYQPLVDMRRGKVVAFEGLLRWQHPERGLLRPADFLPDVEGSELDAVLGRWVLGEGVRQLARWREMGLSPKLQLNVSAGCLLSPGFNDELTALLAASPGLKAHDLEIEIIENTALKNLDRTIEVLGRCHKAGIDIALDDFGAGHASLSCLRRLPVDTLKIDQEFVQSVLGEAEDLAVVESVVGLTRAFNRRLVAEGVESAEIGMLLLSLGCDIGQGYAIARPMPADAIPAWTAEFSLDKSWSFPLTQFSRDDMPLFMAELHHRSWVRQIGDWIEGDPEVPSPPSLSAGECRFGQWYEGIGKEHYGHLPSFQDLGELHQAVHRLGTQLVELCQNGRGEEAKQRFGELVVLRDQLVERLALSQAELLVENI